jgi:anti-anti-sigma factor
MGRMGSNVSRARGLAMSRPYQHLDYADHGGVFCVQIKTGLHENTLDAFGDEMSRLVDEEGCRKLVLCLGPGDFECLYSVFLAKLINVQRKMDAVGGTMALAELSENTQDVFRATGLDKHFKFFPDRTSAIKALA